MRSLASQLREEMLARQRTASTVEDLFDEEPVPLDVFVEDRAYLRSKPLGPEQFKLVQHIERVYLPQTYLQLAEAFDAKKQAVHFGYQTTWKTRSYWSEEIRMVNHIVAQWGKGGGKDSTVRIATARVAYLLLCLKDPLGYFRFPDYESLHMLNVAPTAKLANEVFFTPLVRMMDRGWFSGRAKALQSEIEFDKNIVAFSGNSDADTQEGLNLVLGVADEVDGFKEPSMLSRGTRSAGAIMKMMASSGASRLPLTFKNVVISFPRYKDSTIQMVAAKALNNIQRLGDESSYYVSGPLATWDVNPLYDQYERIEVSGSPVPVPNFPEFIEQFDEINGDPVDACTKYLCEPPDAENAVFRNIEILDRALPEVDHQPLTVNYELRDGHWVATYDFAPDLLPYRGALYAMHADLAITADRAGVALAHVERYETRLETSWNEEGEEVTLTHRRPVVKVDFVISYEAKLGLTPPRQIQIRWARELFFELRRRGFRVVRYTYDGYESRDSRQLLELQGVETDRVSTDRDPGLWRNLEVLMTDERLKGYRRMPLYRELRRLTRLKNGKVDHPQPPGPNNSKDEADALAGAVFGAVEVGGAESGEPLKGMAPDRFVSSGRFADTGGRGGLRGGFSPSQLRIGFER